MAGEGMFEGLLRGLLEASEAGVRCVVDGEWTAEEVEAGRPPQEALRAFGRIMASTLADVRAKIPAAAAAIVLPPELEAEFERVVAQHWALEDEVDDLAEHVDQLASVQQRQEENDEAGLPAGEPIPPHLIDVFRQAVSWMVDAGATQDEARLALARDVRAPGEVPGGKFARRVLLKARRRYGHAEVTRARRLITVPAIFSILFACQSTGGRP